MRSAAIRHFMVGKTSGPPSWASEQICSSDGFYSFWTAERIERLSSKYFYDLTEAHNGYIEVYLNGGLIGWLYCGNPGARRPGQLETLRLAQCGIVGA
jgi:hypothetical protein